MSSQQQVLASAYSGNITCLALSHVNSPFISVYTFTSGGFGAKYSNPVTLSDGTGLDVTFSNSGEYIAVAYDSLTVNAAVYPWSIGGFGVKFAEPGGLPFTLSLAFSPSGSTIAMSHAVSPYVSAYPWSGAGFGTKYADPAPLPTGTVRGVAFTNI